MVWGTNIEQIFNTFLTYGTWFGGVFMFLFMLHVYSKHAAHGSATSLLGLIDRRGDIVSGAGVPSAV
jgi:hypothetical protein